MHYYKRNLGDYAKKAGRLSMLQHGAYTLLMDSCYDREQFPTLDEAIDWTWASSKEEIEAVEFVLKKFFVLEGDVYVQPRIKEEIDEYHAKAETNKRIAREREAKRREKQANGSGSNTNRSRIVHEPSPLKDEAPPNQEPRTKNQEPKDYSSEAVASDIDGGADDSPPPKKPRPERFTPDDYRLAERMAQAVLRVAPKSKAPDIAKWADTIRLMRERDGLTLGEITEVFRFAHNDSFWRTNILSPTKLREHFARLDAQMRIPTNEKRHTTSAARWAIDHDDTSWLTGAQGSGDCIDGELDFPPNADDLHCLEAGRGGRH